MVMARMEQAAHDRRMDRYRVEARLEAQRVAQIAHELRTPLGLIKGYAATLEAARDRLSSQEVQEFLHTIVDEAEQLEGRVNDLLTLAAWNAEGVRLVPRLLQLAPWLDRVIRRFPPDAQSRCAITCDPDLRVWADPIQLADAVTNVIHNALKYSRGPVEITGAQENGGGILLRVRDWGPGVAERDLPRIFDRFYRSYREKPDPARGTGLGLSIARAVVLAHEGRIDAENAPLGGLMVTIRLPRGDVRLSEDVR
jgi:signal transduction histidine kinase